jgi:hypothetical protein
LLGRSLWGSKTKIKNGKTLVVFDFSTVSRTLN